MCWLGALVSSFSLSIFSSSSLSPVFLLVQFSYDPDGRVILLLTIPIPFLSLSPIHFSSSSSAGRRLYLSLPRMHSTIVTHLCPSLSSGCML